MLYLSSAFTLHFSHKKVKILPCKSKCNIVWDSMYSVSSRIHVIILKFIIYLMHDFITFQDVTPPEKSHISDFRTKLKNIKV